MIRPPSRFPAVWFCGLVTLLPLTAAGQSQWPQFRAHAAVAEEAKNLPAEFGPQQHVVWKTSLPGHGSSSPIVVGDRLFLTSYSGYGLDPEKPGEEKDLVRHVLGIRQQDGKILWQKKVPAAQPESSYVDVLRVHGYATNSPTSDGKTVYAFLGKSGIYAYGLDGTEQWHADIGDKFHYWGTGGSLVLHEGRLLVNAAIERYSLFALDPQSGEVQWRTKNLLSAFSTPVVVSLPKGGQEIVVSMLRKVVAIDPATGEKRWTCDTGVSHAGSSVAAKGDVVFAMASPRSLLAIRAGGSGDVSKSRVLWKADGVGSSISTPVYYLGHLYLFDRGIASCVRAEDGKIVYRQRLSRPGAVFYASPVVADGKIYAVSREHGIFVLPAKPEFAELAHNTLDDSVFNATPAVSGDRIYFRSRKFLYSVGRAKPVGEEAR